MKLRLILAVQFSVILFCISLFNQALAQTSCPNSLVLKNEDVPLSLIDNWSDLRSEGIANGNYNRSNFLEARKLTLDELRELFSANLTGPKGDELYAQAASFFDCHLANDPLLADGATATSKLAEGGASAAQGASVGNDGGSLNRETDSSRMRKVHNPAADAKGCVKMIQTSSSTTVRISGNFSFTNECNSAVEIFWCFPKPDGRCGSGGTWTVSAGRGWPVMDNEASIRWGACRGRDGGGWNRGAEGATYTCHLLTW